MEKAARIHVAALTATKLADGLIDPKLVLSWLLTALSAPGFLIGLLVPVREAGALLPQLLVARAIARAEQRKYFWMAGSAVQGLAALGMAASALTLSGAAAGWGILICLAVLAVARALCSASHKDVLASTVKKGRRGRVSGVAGTASAVLVFGFAVMLATGFIPREPVFVACAIAVAGGLWLLAAAIFGALEEPADTDGETGRTALETLIAPLQEDPELRSYIVTRALLISTALAPPFLVMLGSTKGDVFGNLGLLMIASALAAIVSSYIWGALSDRSSRQVLMLAGVLATLCFAAAAALGYASGGAVGGLLTALLVFVAQIAYQGARAGRKTHLTDMDTDGQKAIYTALSNSVIGLLLLAGGAFGLLADIAGPAAVLALLAVLSAGAIFTGAQLSEVQQDA